MQGFDRIDGQGGMGQKVQAIIAEAVRLVSVSQGMVLIYILVTAGAGFLVDFMQWNEGGDLLVNAISIGMGFVLFCAYLRDGGLLPGGLHNGFWPYIGLSLLSGIAILFGLLLLVIPGIVLTVRWLPAYGFQLAEGENFSDALGQSWARTGAHFWPILAALAMPIGMLAIGMVLYAYAFDELGNAELFMLLVANAVISVSMVVFTAIEAAVYALVRDVDAELGEVFA